MKNEDLNIQIDNDLKIGLDNLGTYERLFRNLKKEGREYLKEYAFKYREEILKIQEIILPAVNKVCSKCSDHCCKIHSPKHMVYTAGAPGGFSFTTFLFARYENPFPEFSHENLNEKICPFWDNGCKFPLGNRSFICISWFCKELRDEVEMSRVEYYLKRAERVVKNFSVEKCLGFK